ncbi:Apolipoprotein N-acyltransferase 2 [Geodia barretti]|uniref:Apolipoprotein N-acyltransferase 2 n=1 Tax=Geodia barretti TaxID=519541 RepID=A0AA35X048_GEOBA|nr:Apolipoprotein N-acyltransferase 2 [Geodia barretti]
MLGPVLRGVAVAAGRLRPYAVAAAWTVYEFLKSGGFLGFPWGLAAYPVNTVTPLIQFTALTGVWGLSLLMALVNAAVAEGVQRPWRRQPVGAYLMVAALAIGALGYGFLRLGTAEARAPVSGPATRIDVALIQHHHDPWPEADPIARHQAISDSLRTLMRLTRRVLDEGDPDLVVWSETALVYQPVGHSDAEYYDLIPDGDPLAPFLRALNAHLITGAPYEVDPAAFEYSNASFLISPGANGFDHYRKQQLVPFAEAVPFWEVDFTVSSETQHLVAARFRSVETARPLLRATNGGITAALDVYGRPMPGSVLPPFTADAALVTLYLPATPAMTPYVAFGDYLPVALIIALIVLLGRHAASSGRRRRSPSTARRTAVTDSPR